MDLGQTKWKNPTDTAVTVRVFVSPGQTNEYKVPAKGETLIPSQFDNGIHQIRNGVIIGGLAPQLVREDKPAELHPALRPPADEKPKDKPKPNARQENDD